MKNTIRLIIISFLSSLLLGCHSSTPQTTQINPAVTTSSLTPSPSILATATSTVISLPTETAQPTFTLAPATPTESSDKLPLNAFEQRCVTIENSLPLGFLNEGTIVLEWEYEWLTYKMMTLTAADEQPFSSPDIPVGSGWKMSPRREWMAYFSGDSLIITSDEALQITRNRKDNWGNPQNWLDTERIVFQSLPAKPTALYIYNPFAEQEELFAPEINDRYEYDREVSGWYAWKLVPDPSLTRLAYMQSSYKGGELEFPPTLVLIDLENAQTLWELKRFSPGDRFIPVWSPDGSQMAVISDDYSEAEDSYRWELFTVNRDGMAKKWIDLKTQSSLSSSDWVEGLKWSPNGRYIAFFGESLYILDTLTQQAFDLCIKSDEWDRFPTNVIIWSPDSEQIIFQRGDAPSVIIDLESNRAVPLMEDINIRPVGWLASP